MVTGAQSSGGFVVFGGGPPWMWCALDSNELAAAALRAANGPGFTVPE